MVAGSAANAPAVVAGAAKTGMALATKIIIGVVAAAVVTAGADEGDGTISVPSQNITALALAATIFYEPNFGDIGNTVADLAAAFGLARSETESINPGVAGVFMDT